MRWDLDECVIVVLSILLVALMGVVVFGTLHVQHTCQRTEDTRRGIRMVLAGKVLIPYSVTETRYVCPDGGEVWL